MRLGLLPCYKSWNSDALFKVHSNVGFSMETASSLEFIFHSQCIILYDNNTVGLQF